MAPRASPPVRAGGNRPRSIGGKRKKLQGAQGSAGADAAARPPSSRRAALPVRRVIEPVLNAGRRYDSSDSRSVDMDVVFVLVAVAFFAACDLFVARVADRL